MSFSRLERVKNRVRPEAGSLDPAGRLHQALQHRLALPEARMLVLEDLHSLSADGRRPLSRSHRAVQGVEDLTEATRAW